MNIREASKSFDKAAKIIKNETSKMTKTEIEFKN
jgi:hypothetical protein